MRSIGTSSHEVSRAMLSASGLPVPFSIRESVDAETDVLSATSRRLSPSSSRRRRTARPSSSVLTSGLDGRFVRFMPVKPITRWVLDARYCFMPETGPRNGTKLVGKLVPKLTLGAAHCEVACLRQHVDSLRHLRIVHRDENSIAEHTSVSRGNQVEAQLEFDESTISIDGRRRDFECRVRGHEITECFE